MVKKKLSIRKWILKTCKWGFITGLILCLFISAAVCGYVVSLLQDEPIRTQAQMRKMIDENAQTGFVFFDDNTPIGQLRTSEDRRLIDTKDIPKTITDALIAIEDTSFYEHSGIDFSSIMRAVKQKVLNESIQTGGSTLTQQLARRVFLNADRTNSRKVKEIILALRLERLFSKDEIMTAYLNKMSFGNGSTGYNVYGIKAAAKGIFNIDDLKQLNIAQAAYLAGLPQSPSRYSTFNGKGAFNENGFNRAIKRQDLVLKRMLEEKIIDKTEYDSALAFDIKSSLAKPNKKAYSTYPYLMLEAERAAAEILVLQKNPDLTLEDLNKKENADLVAEAQENLLRGGYKIYTTINKSIYDLMHEISSNKDNFSPDDKTKGVEQIAATLINHKTGAILGMIEGRDFYLEQMNYATQMLRQPGSAMKTIAAYLPALGNGLIQPASIIDDAPIVLKDGITNFHIPSNANNRYQGLVTARKAFNQSLNLPALKIFLDKVGIEKSWEFVRQLGITTIQPEDNYAQTGVLGGLKYGVSVEELTNAYGTIANKGVFHDAFLIQKITDAEGNLIYEHKEKNKKVISEETAYLMTDMLKTVISDPAGTAARLKNEFKKYKEVPIAGKTGSTQNYADVWFVGFTPDVTLGVWSGYEKPIHTLSTAGKSRARKIWASIMNEITAKHSELFTTSSFEKPENIVSMTVSGYSGKLPTTLTKNANKLVTDIFNKKYLPTEEEDVIVNARIIRYNGINYLANPKTPNDMVEEKVVFKREKTIQELMEEIEKALPSMPEKKRKSLQSYMPQDASLDAPFKEDPRVDDGAAPPPPQDVLVEVINSTAKISFSQSNVADIVGYRLYRSRNNGNYEIVSSPILSGDSTAFKNDISSSDSYSYYITAVDVVGNESEPSNVVTIYNNEPNNSGQPETIPGEIMDQPPSEVSPPEPDPVTDSSTSTDGESQFEETPIGADTSAPSSSDNPPTHADIESTDPPEPPTHLTLNISNNQSITLSWTKNPDKDNVQVYSIYRSERPDGSYQLIDSTSQTHYTFKNNDVSGVYRISAINSNGESAHSAVIEIESK